MMKTQGFKNGLRKALATSALVLGVVIAGGTVLAGSAQAQDRDHRWRDNDRHDRDDHAWRRDNDDSRWRRDHDWNRDRDWNRGRNVYVYPAPRVYTYPGGYYGGGYYGGGYGSGDYQRGYSDGVNRGREDARDGRSFNPNNSSHYRFGDSAYRDGFRRGYDVGFAEFRGYRRW